MIDGDGSRIAIQLKDSRLILQERPKLFAILFGCIIGLFWVAVGSFVIYLFTISPNAPRPFSGIGKQIAGWTIILVICSMLGLLPFWMGLKMIFVRQEFDYEIAKNRLQKILTVGRLKIWKKTFISSDRISIKPRNIGRFGRYQIFVVSCGNESRELDLVAFDDQKTAKSFASNLAGQMNLRLIS